MSLQHRQARSAAGTDMRDLVGESHLFDRRGAISTEYILVVGLTGLMVMVALLTVGPKLVKDFERTRNITAAPTP